MVLPRLDNCEIPIPSELFQLGWRIITGKEDFSFFEVEYITSEYAMTHTSEKNEQYYDEIYTIDDRDYHARITCTNRFDRKTKTRFFVLSGETTGGHGYYVVSKDTSVTIFLDKEESTYFIPLLLTLNEFAEEFGMKKCRISFDEPSIQNVVDESNTEKYRRLPFDELFDHFAESRRHNTD